MEKIGIDYYYKYGCHNYFKIDYDRFLRKDLKLYKNDDNLGIIKLQKDIYLRENACSQELAFYAFLEK